MHKNFIVALSECYFIEISFILLLLHRSAKYRGLKNEIFDSYSTHACVVYVAIVHVRVCSQ